MVFSDIHAMLYIIWIYLLSSLPPKLSIIIDWLGINDKDDYVDSAALKKINYSSSLPSQEMLCLF